MSKHLHYKTTYCFSCGNVALVKCSVCGMPICEECNRIYSRKCDLCAEKVSRAESVMVGSMDNEYRTANSPYHL